MESQRDPELLRIHNRSGLTTPDGMPMVWCGKRAGATWMRRVYGPDLMLALAAQAAAPDVPAERFTAKAVGMPERIRITAPSASPPLPPLGRKTLALSSTTPTSKDSRQPSRRSKAAPRRSAISRSTRSRSPSAP